MKKKLKVIKDISIERKNQVEQGFFDGRYRNRTIPNKKKKESKEWARKG